MEELWTLLMLSLAMLVGCYIAGMIPLTITLSEEKLRQVTVMGAGLLVGTALAVIIPEGVHTMYETQLHKPDHHHVTEKSMDAAQSVPNGGVSHDHEHESHDHAHAGTEVHTFIGMALVLGFIFMLLVDQLSGGGGHMHSPVGDVEPGSVIHRHNMTATLGLVVHAAADGIALGAAASTSQRHVEMIVFIAIMLHKAPAAFGLVSFLLHDGFDRTRIRKHLLVFSLAAPVMAVLTFFGLSQQSKEVLTEVNATGIAMLFSGGTFLYVATVHILPELANMGTSHSTLHDGTSVIREQKGFTKQELLLMVTGSLLPLLLSIGHHH